MNFIAFLLQSAKYDGQPLSQFKAYALAHKSKAMHGVAYDPNDPASAYTNENVKARLDGYTHYYRTPFHCRLQNPLHCRFWSRQWVTGSDSRDYHCRLGGPAVKGGITAG